MDKNYKVSCFGAGFVGLPTSSVLAFHNPTIKFVVYDIDANRIKSCSNGIMPIFEPHLEEIVGKVHKKNLEFSTSKEDALDHTSVIFLALPTPTKTTGENAGKAYDLSYTQKAVNTIVKYYNENSQKMMDSVILVQKSTVPIGTSKMLSRIIAANSASHLKDRYIITSNPEFLAEGTAINDLMKPDRVVIGSKNQKADIEKLLNLYNYVANERIIRTNSSSAELSKLAANCFLAQRVSSINSIAILCEEYQSDVAQIKNCIASDSRIGDKFLNSSVGFGGSCFKKDMLALIYLAECKGLQEVADYWNVVIKMNDFRKKTFFKRIFKTLNQNLKGKKIAIFGTAFKKDTCDARQSPAIDICKDLLIQGAILNIYDPKTKRQTFIQQMKYNEVWSESFNQRIVQFRTASEAIEEVYAIVILTQWDQFKTLDYTAFYQKVNKPAIIFDGRNILDSNKIAASGFKLCKIGKKFEMQQC